MLLAANPLPDSFSGELPATLDQCLSQAMERNPEIATARAKLQLAEAELSGARMEITSKIIDLWSARQSQTATAESARRNADFVGLRAKPGLAQVPEVEAANKALIDAEAAKARTETQLRYLIGQVSPRAERSGSAANEPKVGLMAAPLRMPRGPNVEKLRQALLQPTVMDFEEVPLADAMNYLADLHHIEIQLDEKTLAAAGIAKDWPVTVRLANMTLAAAVQALDDKFGTSWKFVVRDYGILVTTPERAEEQGYYPLVNSPA